MYHIPVLLHEVIEVLQPKSGGIYLDCTLGDGGHSEAILIASEPDGRVIGIDADSKQVAMALTRLERFGKRFKAITSRFSRLDVVTSDIFDGILFDLGYSSSQLARPEYGLSFQDDSPLDMRLGDGELTAELWLNRASEVEIADALYHFGDRHNSRVLARKIMAWRKKSPFRVAHDLKVALGLSRPGDIAPIWQAIRIVVNDEFGELERALPIAFRRLKPGGALAVISFHSGEDRIVKRFFAGLGQTYGKPKRLTPERNEVAQNVRARAAKLRFIRKQENA